MLSENCVYRLSGAGYFNTPGVCSEGIVSFVCTDRVLKSNNTLRYFFNEEASAFYMLEADPDSLHEKYSSNGGMNTINIIGSGNITSGNTTGTGSFVLTVNDLGVGKDMYRIIIMSTSPDLNHDSGMININAGDLTIETCLRENGSVAMISKESIEKTSALECSSGKADNSVQLVKINNRCSCSLKSVNDNVTGYVSNPEDALDGGLIKLNIQFCKACGRGIGGSSINYTIQHTGSPDFILHADNLIGTLDVQLTTLQDANIMTITGKGNVSNASMDSFHTNFIFTVTVGAVSTFRMVVTPGSKGSACIHDSGVVTINSGQLIIGSCPWR